ncbi:MAG: hypothetical protein J3R72DRAFT_454149 [Linnemannia gamsii]|nr:MAG: hypothetical protein J3R72DRAFT_454149 [Linnemannia gamsii]
MESWSAQDQVAIAEMVMARSAATLEVLWIEVSYLDRGLSRLNPFCLRRGGVEGEIGRVGFSRLKELVIRTGKQWLYPDIVTPCNINTDNDDNGVHGSGLGDPSLHVNFPVLERLSLSISDAELDDCNGCHSSLGTGRKNPAKRAILERQRLQKQESHRRQFASRLSQLFSSLRSCSSLNKLAFHWHLCATIQDMTQKDLLERVNGDKTNGVNPLGDHVDDLFCFPQDRDRSTQESATPGPVRMTAKDLGWMDLTLPTQAQVERRMAIKAKARQQKEWEKQARKKVQDDLSITRYSDPMDPLYRRIGRGWQDLEGLLVRCGCVFPQVGERLGAAGCSSRQRFYEDDDSYEWIGCPLVRGCVGSELEDLWQLY